MKRLSTLIDEFLMYLKIEKEGAERTLHTYRFNLGYFTDFLNDEIHGVPGLNHLTSEWVKKYHYSLSERGMQSNTIRGRLAAISSFSRWAVRSGKLERNPLDQVTRPKRKRRFPIVPKWEAVESMIQATHDIRDKAVLALLAYGGLRRAEVVQLDMRDYSPEFGLRMVHSKGGDDDTVPLPVVARDILSAYVAAERQQATPDEPLFVVKYLDSEKRWRSGRMHNNRVYKIVKRLGKVAGMDELHPHAFRHGCGVELLKRTGGNLRAVQGYLRHADIQTTTLYTHLSAQDLQGVASVFDRDEKK